MNISIIGTNGFLSRSLSDFFLRNGYYLHMYGRSKPNHAFSTFTQMDLINKQPDYDTLCLSDIIIYTVGAGIQSNLKENNHLIYSLNVSVPISICNKLKEYNYKGIFISFGSVFEVGNTPNERFFDETDILTSLAPAPNDYTISKRMLTRFIQAYKKDFTHWHFIIPTIYGETENPSRLIPYTINAIETNTPLSFTNGDQTRQYIYVNEVPIIIQKALEKELPDGIYNIEGNETLTVKEIVTIIHNAFGLQVPDNCFGKVIRADTGMKYLAMNGQKLREILNFKPTSKIEDLVKKY